MVVAVVTDFLFLPSEWLARAEPITKESVKEAHKVMEAAVKQVQEKHQQLNTKRIAEYQQHKRLLGTGETTADELPVSREYAALLDKFK
jgi:hypothetical protein